MVINLPGPAAGPNARQVRAPDQVLRIWAMLNATHDELHAAAGPGTPGEVPGLRQSLRAARAELERSVSGALVAELGRLLYGQMPSPGPDELRLECAGLLGWTGGLVLAMLSQLETAADTALSAQTAAPPARSLRSFPSQARRGPAACPPRPGAGLAPEPAPTLTARRHPLATQPGGWPGNRPAGPAPSWNQHRAADGLRSAPRPSQQ